MSSIVSISNLCIASLGSKAFIQSIDEASVEARYCKLFYDQCREATLRAHPWNFATSRVSLALIGDAPTPYLYQYALPSNCLKARYIVPTVATIPETFEITLNDAGTSKVINTKKEDAVLVYTANVTNTELFDSLYTETFIFKMASALAPVIAPSKTQEMLTKYVNALRQAQAVDASEGDPEIVEETDWLEARIAPGVQIEVLERE